MEQKVIHVKAKAVSLRWGLHGFKETTRVVEEKEIIHKKIIATVKARKQAHHDKYAKKMRKCRNNTNMSQQPVRRGKREEYWRHNSRKLYLSINASNIMDQ